MEYLKKTFIKSALIISFLYLFIFPQQFVTYGQDYGPTCDNDGITANLTYPYPSGNITQALVDRNGGRGNEGIAVWRVGTTRPSYSGDDPYLATNLLPCTDYNYEAYTRNGCAGSDTYGGVFRTQGCAGITPTIPPPGGQSHTCNGNGTVTVRWAAQGGASSYTARLDHQGPMSGGPIYNWQSLTLGDQYVSVTTLSHTFVITNDTRYQWAVSTVNSSGVGGNWAWNAAFSCAAPPPTPIPQLEIRVRNPAGAPVAVPKTGFTYNACASAGHCIGAEQANSSTVTFNAISGWQGGGGVVLNSNQRLLGITPNPVGGAPVNSNFTPRNELWQNYWWPSYPYTGTRSLYFIVADIYSITYNGNGNTGGSAPAAQTKTHNVNLTLQTNTGNLTRTGYTFAGWNTAANGTGTNYAAGGAYTANAGATLYARWTINTYTVTSPSVANGTVTPNTRTVNHGSTTTFTITPNTGYRATASGCGGSLTGTTYTTGVITGNCTVTATFIILSYPLSVSKSGNGSGTVTSSPAGINCGSTCTANFNHGTNVTLTPSATAGSRFTGWSGACTGTGTCTVSMTQTRAVTANFVLLPDLVPSTITRAAPPSTSSSAAYTITYCNNGPGAGGATFTIQVVNTQGTTITTTATVPAANGGCSTTTVTCLSLGDSFAGINCNENSTITVTLDITPASPGSVIETNEGNNTSPATSFAAVASEPFYKLSNASLHRLQTIDIPMPAAAVIQQFDTIDDTTATQLDINAAGLVSSSGLIRVIGGTVSANNFQRDSYTDVDTYLNSLNTFINYANAQKPTNVIAITDPNPLSKIQANTVNIFGTGSQTLNINAQPTATQTDYVLLVNGNVNITTNPIYNTIADNSIAIIATGTITIATNVSEVNAILIANNIVLGTSATPLKIKGNLISNTAINMNNARNRTTNPDVQPNVFIVFNPKMYLDLLPHLSDITVEGRQVE